MADLLKLNEDLVRHNCVHSMHFDMEHKSLKCNLILVLGISEYDNEDTISITFKDISDFNLNCIGGGLVQFMDLEIRKLDNGYDRLKYEVSDLENNMISFKFYAISLFSEH